MKEYSMKAGVTQNLSPVLKDIICKCLNTGINFLIPQVNNYESDFIILISANKT